MTESTFNTEKPHIHIKPKKGWQVIDINAML